MDDGQTDPTEGAGLASFKRPITAFLVLLLAMGLALTGSAAYRVLSGVPDSYSNQQLRLLAGGVTQVFLAGAMLSQQRGRLGATWLLLALSIGGGVWSIALM